MRIAKEYSFEEILMEMRITWVLLLLCFTGICEPGWSYFNGFCYFTSDSCANWTTALTKCRMKNSVLADVGSNEENVYIQHRHNGQKSWLGLNDISTEGNFTWADAGLVNWTAWEKNQPTSFGDEDCTHTLGFKYNYKWNDAKCSDCHPYTCKKGNISSLWTIIFLQRRQMLLSIRIKYVLA